VSNKVKKEVLKNLIEKKSNFSPTNTFISKNIDSKKPFFPNGSPFSSEQKFWISGFLSGLKQNSINNTSDSGSEDKISLSLFYGTQTGNSENIARDTANLAEKNNFLPSVMPLDDISMEQLKNIQNAIFIVSTYGEGEMPDNAQLFWESLSSDTAPKLENLNFGVLALGDTGYEEFCNAGKLIDFRLEQLGAKRIMKRIDCDVDFEKPSKNWINSILPIFNNTNELVFDNKSNINEEFIWNKSNPYFAEISENKLLSGSQSKKEIKHYEIELADSKINYDVGDTLNVFPVNNRRLVELILERLGTKKNYKPSGFSNTIQFLLLNNFEISTPNKNFIEKINLFIKDEKFEKLLSPNKKKELDSFLWGKDILDILNINPKTKIDPEKFLSLLRPLQPRAYSISSSPKMHLNQVHLTISSVKWENSNRIHEGVCSNFLANSETSVSRIGVYVTPNNSFRLPDNDTVPIIMIGPGTGLAPFRAFLEERKMRKASGKNWLFFGDQTRKNDFIYEKEINDFKNSGLLTKLDLAFSRDQNEKVYVQHKMLQSSAEIFSWINDGAYIYVCGDATYMAKDVDKALFNIVKKEGKHDDLETKGYIDQLKKEKRYLRDVY
tara:strand:+ start:69553 stop:71379 length:1827 start_codon:yes stop_codon:yes gene_type:complete